MKTNTSWGKIGGMNRAVGYARVSTPGQAAEGVSIDAQRSAIKRYCDSTGLCLEDVFVDAGLSGRRASNRPELERALSAVCRNKGLLISYSLSRVARSLRDVLRISDRLEQSNAELVVLAENIDTSTASGKLFFHLMGSLGQFEADLISERTKAALAHKREQGQRWCNSAPYGFRWHRGVLHAQPSEQRVLKRMIRLRKRGLSYRAIANELRDGGVTNREGSSLTYQQIHRLLIRNLKKIK